MKASNIDIFGQKVNLNLGKKGETFNSPYGIIVSLMIFMIVGIYSIIRSKVLIL